MAGLGDLPTFLPFATKPLQQGLLFQRKEKERQHASVFRFVPCAPLKSFKVEVSGGTRKLIAHLTPGASGREGRPFQRRAVTQAPSRERLRALLLWSHQGDSSHSLYWTTNVFPNELAPNLISGKQASRVPRCLQDGWPEPERRAVIGETGCGFFAGCSWGG